MKHAITALILFLLARPAPAPPPVCHTFTDAEIADLLGKPATVKRSILGAENDCLWSVPGLMFTVSRIQADAETAKGIVESQMRSPAEGDIVKAEPGIGDAAVSTQGRYGRSVKIAFRAGTIAWTMNLEKVDQKLDMAAALSKLRALAKKAAADHGARAPNAAGHDSKSEAVR